MAATAVVAVGAGVSVSAVEVSSWLRGSLLTRDALRERERRRERRGFSGALSLLVSAWADTSALAGASCAGAGVSASAFSATFSAFGGLGESVASCVLSTDAGSVSVIGAGVASVTASCCAVVDSLLRRERRERRRRLLGRASVVSGAASAVSVDSDASASGASVWVAA